MSENLLTLFGDLTKPATVLVEKISNAVGIIYEPTRIRRKAAAERDAMTTLAVAEKEARDIELLGQCQRELRQRAFQRFAAEEERKQANMESIMEQALPGIELDAPTDIVEDDWLVNFFDKCRLISDEELKSLWARVLVGEGNSPGRFSKRTVNLLSSLDKRDAILFGELCNFCWNAGRGAQPFIFELNDQIHKDRGLDFQGFTHLASIGLINLLPIPGFSVTGLSKRLQLNYFDVPTIVEFQNDEENELEMGHVMLTQAGQQLAGICEVSAVPGYRDYVIAHWTKRYPGIKIIPPEEIN